jgi:hypothetical protein
MPCPSFAKDFSHNESADTGDVDLLKCHLVLLRSVALPEFCAVHANDASVWQDENIIFRAVATPATKADFPTRLHL